MYLINVAVDELTADRVFKAFLTIDAVAVELAVFVTAIAFSMLVTVASVIDKRIR